MLYYNNAGSDLLRAKPCKFACNLACVNDVIQRIVVYAYIMCANMSYGSILNRRMLTSGRDLAIKA